MVVVRAHARAGAWLVAALFLVTIVPTSAQAQGTLTAEVGTGQGVDVWWTQHNVNGGNAISFISNASSPEAVLHVKVTNNGTAISRVPVYYYFADINYQSGCTLVDLASGTDDPTEKEVTFIVNTRDLPPGGHNVTVEIMPSTKPAKVASECPSPTTITRSGSVTCGIGNANCRNDTNMVNNKANAYFVKDRFLDLHVREIRWCPGFARGEGETLTCQSDMLVAGRVYNSTPYYGNTTRVATFFEVVVEPLPGENAWLDLENYGGRGDTEATGVHNGWEYELNITVRGFEYNATKSFYPKWTEQLTNRTIAGEFGHRARSDEWVLLGKAGTYNVTVKVDPSNALRRVQTAGSVTAERDIEVAHWDFTGNISASEFRTNPADPYPYPAPGRIIGNVTFVNNGTHPMQLPLPYRIYLDNHTDDGLFESSGTATIATLGRFVADAETQTNSVVIPVDWAYTGTPGATNYLPPGKHTIHARIDWNDSRLESNELNNNLTLDIYVEDSSDPILLQANITPPDPQRSHNATNKTDFLPLEDWNLWVRVQDADANLNVTANFTLDRNPNITRNFTLRLAEQGTPGRYILQNGSFNYADFVNRSSYRGYENWTARVRVTDSFGNNVTSPAIPYRLMEYPLHKTTPGHVIVEPEWPNASTPFGTDAEFTIRVEPNMTGFDGRGTANQQVYTANMHINFSRDNVTKTFTQWTAQTPTLCNTDNTPSGGGGLFGGGASCTDQDEVDNNTFYMRIDESSDTLGPGLWNYSVVIKDIANQSHAINGTLRIVDAAPQITAWNLSTGIDQTIAPGTTFRVFTNVTDDDSVAGANVLFHRASGNITVNFTLTNGSNPDGNSDFRTWNDSIETGRGKMLGIGGNFSVSLAAVDGAGNWNVTRLGYLVIEDIVAPEIEAGNFGVIPAAAEIGENVTFWAKVRDATNVSVTLNVFRASGGDETLHSGIVLNESLDGNFTTTLNFSAEAIHGWQLIPTDSVGNQGGIKTGSLTIRDNLGPRYDVRSPEVVIDGTRYGGATPRIEVIVHDFEGVAVSSIDMKVAGQPANFQVLDAPGNLDGYLITYTVPSNRKFDHLNEVTVNLSARDNSSEQLQSFFNFSFVVDAVAPRARMLSISPSYRDQPAHTLNVSVNSRFTLAAEDADQVPTEVASIRYRIIGGGPGGPETIYTGPFNIDDAPGIYNGPRLYQVQFWAEDAVGNSGQLNANVTTVYVDETPPTLFQFFPQPRSVNATFVDDRVGVNKSVVWLRVNDRPYEPLQLNETDGTWRASLPSGRLGDRISYYLQVWDKLDNDITYGNATAPYASFDVSNQEPTIRLVTPVEGARVGRTVELSWDANDPDGQALVFTVFYKKPGSSTFVELRRFEESTRRAYTVDVSNASAFPDGQYTFRVAAGDGAFVSIDEVSVILIKSATPVGAVGLEGDAVPGSTVLLTAQVTKAEAIVEARLYLGGVRVGDPIPMNDAGDDGDAVAGDSIYSARVSIPDAGDYRVEIFTQYREDGVTKDETIESAYVFSAKLTPGYVLAEYGAIIALIGLLAAVGIGVAVFVVMRRR